MLLSQRFHPLSQILIKPVIAGVSAELFKPSSWLFKFNLGFLSFTVGKGSWSRVVAQGNCDAHLRVETAIRDVDKHLALLKDPPNVKTLNSWRRVKLSQRYHFLPVITSKLLWVNLTSCWKCLSSRRTNALYLPKQEVQFLEQQSWVKGFCEHLWICWQCWLYNTFINVLIFVFLSMLVDCLYPV